MLPLLTLPNISPLRNVSKWFNLVSIERLNLIFEAGIQRMAN